MKVFVLNLDRDTERMAALDKRLNELGVPYERVSGIYGKDLSDKERRDAVNRFRYLCARGYLPRVGEIGCQLSHQKAYHKIIDEKIEVACILEDDVKLDDRFPWVLREVEKWYDPSKPQLVLLSNHCIDTGYGNDHEGFTTPKSDSAEPERFSVESSFGDMFAEGYILGSLGARNLLAQNAPMIVPADHWGRWVEIGAINLYHAFPTVCSQNKCEFESGTAPAGFFDVSKLSLPARFAWKVWRLLGTTIDRILMKVLKR